MKKKKTKTQHNPEKLSTQGTQDEEKLATQGTQDEEKLATQGTQDEEKQNKNTTHVLDTTMRKTNTNNVNKPEVKTNRTSLLINIELLSMPVVNTSTYQLLLLC